MAEATRASALIVVDMLNPYEHDDADVLAAHVEAVLGPLVALIDHTHGVGGEVVYVNDNYGDFAATRDDLVARANAGRRPDLVEPIVPRAGTAFLPKVRHSAFYSTTLEYLLQQRGIEEVVLAGQVTEQCILYTALDAYVRHYRVSVPSDSVAPIDRDLGDAALRMMQRNMRAAVVGTAELIERSSTA